MTLELEPAQQPAFTGDPLGGSPEDRLARLPEVVDELRRADAEAERDRVLQYWAVERLRRTGALGLRVPTRYGGPGGSVRDVATAVVQIARGSSNVAQALRAHFGFSERLLSNRATEAERQQWLPVIESGGVFGNAITDAKGKSPSSSGTTLLADATGVLRLNGFKFYSTGTLFADHIAVSAVDADGQDLQAIVPTDRDGVERYDDWDGFGQRLTASGSTRRRAHRHGGRRRHGYGFRSAQSNTLIALLQIDLGQIVLVHQLDEFAHLLYIKDVARSGTRIRTHQYIPAGNSIRELYVMIRPDSQDASTQSSSCFGTSVRTS